MNKVLIIIILLIVVSFTSKTRAQFNLPCNITSIALKQPGFCGTNSAVTSYIGPGDITTFDQWGGVRAYNAVAAATNAAALIINRASDGHSCTVNLSISGDLGLTASCGTGADNGQTGLIFCTATICKVSTIFDQTGNGFNWTQIVAGSQPVLSFTCFSGAVACLLGNAAALMGSNPGVKAQPFTYSFVAQRTAAFTTIGNIGGDTNATSVFFGASNAVNTWRMSAGTAMPFTASDSVGHSFQLIYNGASSIANVDNSTTSLSPGANSTATNFSIIGLTAGLSFTGQFAEIGRILNAPNSTIQTSLCNNQRLYYGTAGTC